MTAPSCILANDQHRSAAEAEAEKHHRLRAPVLLAQPGALRTHSVHVLESLQAEPLLDLGLRLGEGSGAALAVPLMRLACDLHGQMATFAQAAVADRPA